VGERIGVRGQRSISSEYYPARFLDRFMQPAEIKRAELYYKLIEFLRYNPACFFNSFF